MLIDLDDTKILLNFQKAITSLYPNLIPIHAYAYDSWDDIVEPLFFNMVYRTFAFKYGVNIKLSETHTYNIPLGCYSRVNHIECIPKQPTINALVNHEWIVLDQNNLLKKVIVFKSFGDGKHCLTGGLEINEASNVNFDLVEVDIFSTKTGYTLQKSVFIDKEHLEFRVVFETYDKNIPN